MIRKAWRIGAAHGPVVLVRRGLARAKRWIAERRHATRLRQAAWHPRRLPSEPEFVAFAPAGPSPLLSIIIPAFERWPLTNACLTALREAWDDEIDAEVIVVDDGSRDETAALLAGCPNVRAIALPENRGFVEAVNAGAEAARGRLLFFLNNDAFVTPGCIRALIETLEPEYVGAAAAQLCYPGGTISEAGGIVWRDARGVNYGRGDDPRDWRYRYAREVDYGSAAALMVRADAFRDTGGFSREFAPAYYEDTDLCFALRDAGLRVVYQPRALVYHLGGASYGSDADA
ncbi:MAG TPA: glycosyltransferase family 2 protein, partial [Verrucomicrobiae bacterium]|nr:glycosyltransferase family 2 protein [Verrucomicrobiae bacterium]